MAVVAELKIPDTRVAMSTGVWPNAYQGTVFSMALMGYMNIE
jgi:hypothetical protein